MVSSFLYRVMMASGMGIGRRALVQRLVLAIVFSTAILEVAASAKAQ